MKSIVILTGAGISAESGLATFRASDGLWCEHRVEDVATPEAYERDAALVQRFYNMRRAQLKEVQPNAAHHALMTLAEKWNGKVTLVTQNVDDLHDRAVGGKQLTNFELLHMHGELKKVRCTESEKVVQWEEDIDIHTTKCACCNEVGTLRPHIVWFGEMPLYMEKIHRALQQCDLFMSIGTSGNVYPAAGFVQEVRMYGRGKTVELNLEPSTGYSLFNETRYGPATQIVPAFVEEILGGKVI